MGSVTDACAINDAKENDLEVTPIRPVKFAARASPRTKEMAVLLSMPSDVDQYSCFMKHTASESKDVVASVPEDCVSFCGNKRSVSALLKAAQFVNEDVESTSDKKTKCLLCDDESSTYYTRMFAKAHAAKNACISSDTAIGVGQELRHDRLVFHVFYQKQTYLKVSEIETDWLYLKARSNHDGEKHLVKLKNAQCNTYKRGVVRRSYSLENGMYLKIYHYSCRALDFPQPCRNCANDKWNSRCLSGNENIVLSFK